MMHYFYLLDKKMWLVRWWIILIGGWNASWSLIVQCFTRWRNDASSSYQLSHHDKISKKRKKKKKGREQRLSREKSSRKNYLLFLLKYIVYARHFIYKTKKKGIETIGVNPWPTGSCYSACLRPWTGHWLAVCNANHGSSGNSYSGDKIYWLFIGTYILYARDFT